MIMITYLPNGVFFRVNQNGTNNTMSRDVTKEEKLEILYSIIEKLKLPTKRKALYELLVTSMREFYSEMSLKATALFNDKYQLEFCEYALEKDHEIGVKLIKGFGIDYAEVKEQMLLEGISEKKFR